MAKSFTIYFGSKEDCEMVKDVLTSADWQAAKDIEHLAISHAGGEFGWELIASGLHLQESDRVYLSAFANGIVTGAAWKARH